MADGNNKPKSSSSKAQSPKRSRKAARVAPVEQLQSRVEALPRPM
ncbi:hypothetical protein AXZ77_3479 [Thioclava sp. ES.031]|nr:hypothetical protein [Thioclava sp. ES.031]PFG64832.1 hypothetical protein AXZ77_3479 [Thioclava sp. ES.031]